LPFGQVWSVECGVEVSPSAMDLISAASGGAPFPKVPVREQENFPSGGEAYFLSGGEAYFPQVKTIE